MNKIIYLDAAASSLKPDSVINAQIDFFKNKYANAGRGICARSTDVDAMVNDTRTHIADFINAASNQIIFTSGATDGLNRIVNIIMGSGGELSPQPHVTVSDLDHHSARMPWENLARAGKCKLSVCPLDTELNINISVIEKTDVLVITAMSNVLGVPQNVAKIIAAARAKNSNVITIVDAAQYVAHALIDVVEWDCDFLCFSGHKIGADTGVGIMYIKQPDKWGPDKFGGGMVAKVNGSVANNDAKWTLAQSPDKFEAGTLPLTQIAGLMPAVTELIKTRGNPGLVKYMRAQLLKIDKINIISAPDAHVLTFTVDGMHCLDFGSLMGAHNICLRVGNMCASWLHAHLGVIGTIRISVGAWNTIDDASKAVNIIKKIIGGISV